MTYGERVWRVRRTVVVEVSARTALLALDAARGIDDEHWESVAFLVEHVGPDVSAPTAGGRDDDYTEAAVDRAEDADDEEEEQSPQQEAWLARHQGEPIAD